MMSSSPLNTNIDAGNHIGGVLQIIRRWPLGVHLLLAINVPLGILLAVLMVFEYQTRMNQAIAEKEASLADESVAVHQAVLHLTREHATTSTTSTAEFIERVCRKMQSSGSPGHTILVAYGGEMLNSKDHGHLAIDADAELLQAFRRGQSRIHWRNEAVVLGGHEEDGRAVVIAELATNIRRFARTEVMWHLGGLILVALLAASIMDAVLWRLIRKPMRRMSATVDAVARGEFGIQLEPPVGRELQILTRSVNVMSEALAMNERHRQREMAQAREIQEHLLPNGVDVPGLCIGRHFRPAEDVAGDYYDFIPLSNGSWLLVVADVAGHGIPAAMAATIFKALLLCATQTRHTPQDILQQVNQHFVTLLPSGRFVTVLLGIWQPESRQLTYVNAGHPAGLVWKPQDGFQELKATAVPVGVQNAVGYQSCELRLTVDDRLVWFTDGLIEAFSPSGEMFGMERLRKVIRQNAAEHPELLLERILVTLREFVGSATHEDDLTLLVIG